MAWLKKTKVLTPLNYNKNSLTVRLFNHPLYRQYIQRFLFL